VNGPESRRRQILSRVTDLFLAEERHDDEKIRLYDEVMGRLIERIEASALAELSARLASIDQAPPNVVMRLAMNDEIEVARPVLSKSNRLSDDDLAAIANFKSQAHMLAICARPRLGEVLTDVLVSRGNAEVAHFVVANPGASFSQGGFGVLAKRAEEDDDLAVRLARRPELPLRVFCALLACGSDIVKERLLAANRHENHLRVSEVVDEVSGRLADAAVECHDYAGALRTVLLLHGSSDLTEHDVLRLAERHRLEEAIAALSIMWSVPIETVEQIMCRGRVTSLLGACKAAGFTWATVRALINASPRLPLPGRLGEMEKEFARLTDIEIQQSLSGWTRPSCGPLARDHDERRVPDFRFMDAGQNR
jgi:uncharacterized protein (DUF2336 family)